MTYGSHTSSATSTFYGSHVSPAASTYGSHASAAARTFYESQTYAAARTFYGSHANAAASTFAYQSSDQNFLILFKAHIYFRYLDSRLTQSKESTWKSSGK